MKVRLFWKIFIGFWLTFMVITEGVWLMYEVVLPVPSELTKSLATISLAAASSAIRIGGENALDRQLASWPRDERGRLTVRPWTPKSIEQHDIDSGFLTSKARDPTGKAYLVSYCVTRFRFSGSGPLDIPPKILGLAMVAGFIFSAILALYLTKPARQMQIGFARLSGGDFSTRLGPAMGRRQDEIADLARGFDEMAANLQELVAARDRLLADVSHELRSPLARLQLAIDLSEQDSGNWEHTQKRIRTEAIRLEEMVDELLTLSRLESSAEASEEYFDFSDVVRLVVEDGTFEAVSKGVALATQIAPISTGQEWTASGSGKLVRRAVENVVRNAIRFSREGQKVEVNLVRQVDTFALTIADEGPGVSEAQIPFLFEPFIKGSSGDGFGLGLSIARRAIIAQGGSISARNRAPCGFIIVIALPVAA